METKRGNMRYVVTSLFVAVALVMGAAVADNSWAVSSKASGWIDSKNIDNMFHEGLLAKKRGDDPKGKEKLGFFDDFNDDFPDDGLFIARERERKLDRRNDRRIGG